MNSRQAKTPIWQILDVRSIWMKEFASALARILAVTAWCPEMSRVGALRRASRPSNIPDPPLEIMCFPLQRGYARAPLRWAFHFENNLISLLRSRCPNPESSPLVCSTPFYAPVAEQWPGPVIYYVTDFTVSYIGVNQNQVRELDSRLCQVASLVCPNSLRIAEYLQAEAGCEAGKIRVIPNATRKANVSLQPIESPQPVPPGGPNAPRPIAGVIGNLSQNMDWILLAEVVSRTPYLSWLFVGPTDMPIKNRSQQKAREWVRRHAYFLGPKPYGELQSYARALDVAILPYLKAEPTYSGSSTRFYEHLAACRPMIATRGFAELLDREPLVELVDTPQGMIDALDRLRACGFRDGWERSRWRASKTGTWEMRARMMDLSLRDTQCLATASAGFGTRMDIQ